MCNRMSLFLGSIGDKQLDDAPPQLLAGCTRYYESSPVVKTL